jgi:hypothetical protein
MFGKIWQPWFREQESILGWLDLVRVFKTVTQSEKIDLFSRPFCFRLKLSAKINLVSPQIWPVTFYEHIFC